jgi:hypothetical protein
MSSGQRTPVSSPAWNSPSEKHNRRAVVGGVANVLHCFASRGDSDQKVVNAMRPQNRDHILFTLRAFIRIRRNEQILLLARCVFGARIISGKNGLVMSGKTFYK